MGKIAAALTSSWGKPEYGLVLLTLFYALGGYALAAAYGQADHYAPLYYSSTTWLVTFCLLMGFFTARVLYVMIRVRPRRLTAYLMNDMREFITGQDRLAKAAPVFFCFIVLISCFTSLKSMIPVFHPFAWDPLFVQIDRALHFGVDPWRRLQPFLGFPFVTTAVNAVYNCWFFIMFAVLYWQLFAAGQPRLRMRFFYTFFLSWIVNGTLLAVLLSSAGPCFYEGVTGSDYFAPLMTYLKDASATSSVWALTTQESLWQTYQQSAIGFGSGIAAMPSMHVSVAFLFALLGWRISRFWGIVFTAYTALILIGSVHLAWHYAIDGYLSMVTTWIIWRACGAFFKQEK